MTEVLVVDDEPQILRALRITLRARGYNVLTAATGAAALESVARSRPDLVVLDLGLPDMDGVDVIRALRGWSTVPVLVLSGRPGSADKVEALDAGADDYVTKPFDVDELLARTRALARRVSGPAADATVGFGDVIVDRAKRIVSRGDIADSANHLRLTRTEWALLDVLLRNPGRLVSHRQLLHEVWGSNYTDETQNVRQYVAQLRRKLEPDSGPPRHLITEPGMGYRFQP